MPSTRIEAAGVLRLITPAVLFSRPPGENVSVRDLSAVSGVLITAIDGTVKMSR